MSLLTKPPAVPISPLVERTAQAIYLQSKNHCTGFTAWENVRGMERDTFYDMARAALTEAYREPVTG